MRIAIYGRTLSDALIPNVQGLIDVLYDHNVDIVVYEKFYMELKDRIQFKSEPATFTRETSITKDIDYLLSLGGDGTMLGAVTIIRDSGVPILGINTGRLGFLATIPADHMSDAVKAIVSNKFSLDSRNLLTVRTKEKYFGNQNFALNEMTVLKQDTSSMITIKTYLNDEFMNSYWADGLIIATPTGSTAYSLSCGGPIISPKSSSFIITPIAPHNLNVRPVVVPDSTEITIEVASRSEQFLAALDSRSVSVPTNTEFSISKSSFQVNLIQVENESFLQTLRTKLMWGLDQRN